MSDKKFHDISPPSLEADDLAAAPAGYHDADVFGREEDHQVWAFRAMRLRLELLMLCEDPVQDAIMAARRCADDCGDCQQRHALSAVVPGGCRSGAGACIDHISGNICAVHELVADSIQAEAS